MSSYKSKNVVIIDAIEYQALDTFLAERIYELKAEMTGLIIGSVPDAVHSTKSNPAQFESDNARAKPRVII